jgi:acetaldehyde dehydrogenase/alcohol dehydrogenase
MKHPDIAFILATGGPSMVKAAYSSGTPAIGVGAGNAPVWICADADREAAAQMVVSSKVFDWDSRTVQRDLIGKSALYIAQSADIKPKGDIRLIVIPASLDEMSGPLGHEKLAPMLSLFVVNGEAEGFAVCKQIIGAQGSGHTAIIHTRDQERAERYALEIPASKVLVNTPSSQGCAGIYNGLTPSLTLGCGTYGGNSTTDNVTYTHLLNIKRMALSLS